MFQVIADDGRRVNAHLDLTETAITFHSRGGARGATNERNSDYGEGLRTLLERLQSAELKIDGAWVDSSVVQVIPLAERQILQEGEDKLGSAAVFRLMSTRMAKLGQSSKAAGGNPTKRIRIVFSPPTSIPELLLLLRVTSVAKDTRSAARLTTEVLAKVGSDHIYNAVQRLLGGFTDHAYGASLDYDLIAGDDERLPPKAVFGLAASEALGFDVLPKHFSAGVGSPCFNALERSGFAIVPKGTGKQKQTPYVNEDEREWVEGKPQLIMHLRRERSRGLAAAKKDAFIRQHGRLYCEDCGLDPLKVFGDIGSITSVKLV